MWIFPSVAVVVVVVVARKESQPVVQAGRQPAEQRALGSELCGIEPALLAFSTDATPYNTIRLCFLVYMSQSDSIGWFRWMDTMRMTTFWLCC